MKFSDFTKKNKAPARMAPRFILQNDAAMAGLQAQIHDLDTQLGYYRTIEAERDAAIQRLTVEKENAVDTNRELSKRTDELADSQRLVEHQEQQLSKLPILGEEIRDANGRHAQVSTELANLTRVAFDQSQTISSLGANLDNLKVEKDSFDTEFVQARADKISLTADLERLYVERGKLRTFSDSTSKINIELKEKVNEMRDKATFWEREASESLVQLKESGLLEGMLRKWVSDLEMKDSQTITQKSNLDDKIISLQNTVVEMSNVLEDMLKEMSYLRVTNKEYRKELSKPRFASMGAIAHREGFVMPTGQENFRKHYLGNSAPTLLKFKGKEEISHAG